MFLYPEGVMWRVILSGFVMVMMFEAARESAARPAYTFVGPGVTWRTYAKWGIGIVGVALMYAFVVFGTSTTLGGGYDLREGVRDGLERRSYLLSVTDRIDVVFGITGFFGLPIFAGFFLGNSQRREEELLYGRG